MSLAELQNKRAIPCESGQVCMFVNDSDDDFSTISIMKCCHMSTLETILHATFSFIQNV